MKKFHESRFLGSIVLLIIYTLATLFGIYIYNILNFDWWLNLLIADVSSTILVFIFSLMFKNSSVYDPYWSIQPIVITILYMVTYYNNITIDKILLVSIILLWGIRLTANFIYTFNGFKYQDWRYLMLKEKTKKLYPVINFLGIHLFPTIVVYLCTLPAVYMIINNFEYNYLYLLILLISLTGVIIQTISDIQMHMYRKNKTTTFIRTGLWKYSRHPNYLGEILMWYGIGLFLALITKKFIYLSGAIINHLMFLFVSIPLADGKQSSKEGFNEYKYSTRMLLPIKK